MSLVGKTVIVTGSGGGLGLIIARTLLTAGGNIVICDVNEARLATVRTDTKTFLPDRVLIEQVDVTDESSVQQMIVKSVARFGRLDMVVNNGAIMDRFDPAGDCPKELWDRVLAVNLTGPFLVTKHAMPHLLAEAGSCIVNIASNASFRGLAGGAAYTASKHGLVGLTRNTAGSYPVACVALILGGMEATNIKDAFGAGVNEEGMRRLLDTQPGNRTVSPVDVARTVVFLGEGMAKSMNGSCVTMNENWPEA
ncbi:hypothetical protein DCS_05127 [Drechmeria coniospora]|uniref:Ketoreductase domain-containing protein n=1 Tax=Drechmeria coniospora TaxID=98403 RepID=A0A151GLX5_DRECN|nr:hypothetical protein DCS_05127 [Drechmeria coniospora]KYK58114.1 hypothetical protein DCS_05127 [Drechmeria coniospora]ODA83047.1 hypothetical protein RJ55_01556 [Drechmeria coniospora]